MVQPLRWQLDGQLDSHALPANGGKRCDIHYLCQRTHGSNLLKPDTAIPLQHALRVYPASRAFQPTRGSWWTHQQVVKTTPTLRYLLLRLCTGDIMQHPDNLR